MNLCLRGRARGRAAVHLLATPKEGLLLEGFKHLHSDHGVRHRSCQHANTAVKDPAVTVFGTVIALEGPVGLSFL